MPRAGQVLEVVHLVGFVNRLELAVTPVLQQLGPHQVGLALYDRVAMMERFLRLQRCMEAAKHNRDTAFAELVAQLVRAQRRADGRRNADQIPSAVEVDVLEAFIAQRHVIIVRRESRHQRNHEPHDQPPSRFVRRAVQMDSRGLHQENSWLLAVHSFSPSGVIDDSVRPVINIRTKANTYVPNAVPQAKYSSRLIRANTTSKYAKSRPLQRSTLSNHSAARAPLILKARQVAYAHIVKPPSRIGIRYR